LKVFYSPDYVAAAESFDTMRKSGWVAESLVSDPIKGVEVVAPRPLEFEEIAGVHDPVYVSAVQTGEPRDLAASQGFTWDLGLWQSVTASTGGVVAAALEAMTNGVSGSLSGGLHHARYARGSGFCTFNGLVIAAKAALLAGVKSVLIIDADAHCGGGTHSLIKDDVRIRQMDVSVDYFDRYNPSGANTLDMVGDADKYMSTLAARLEELQREEWKPDLCLYNSGMDPDERCRIGGLRGMNTEILSQRETMVFEWCGAREIPIAFVLAGGYVGAELSQRELVSLHRRTIEVSCLTCSSFGANGTDACP
jgi:acetoin utilization deacetylase AcuC-like enzyme